MSRGSDPSEAQLHESASEPAVDTCWPCPYGTWAGFAATLVAARAVAKIHASRNPINTAPQQSRGKSVLDKTARPMKSFRG